MLKQPEIICFPAASAFGACHAQVEHVGADNYAACIANEARKRAGHF
ncbi:MAG: hypothetical protein ACLVJ6_11570 [Merdibacter sp.]